MNIYVGNLSSQVTEKQLEGLFASFGTVRSVKVVTDEYTGRSKGFGFVIMPDINHAERAIKNLNNTRFDTNVITVNEAKPKVERHR